MAEIQETTEPETTDTVVADAPAADSDIDALLREFEEGTSQPQPAEQISEAAAERDRAIAANLNAYTEGLQIDQRRNELSAAQQQLQAEYDARDAAAAFSEIRGSLPAEMFDDAMIDSWITSQALRDQSIHQAWLNRAADPKTYQRTLAKLATEFGEKFRRYQPQQEIDYEAVAAAVRHQGGRVPEEPPPDLSKMSDQEFRRYKQSLGIND